MQSTVRKAKKNITNPLQQNEHLTFDQLTKSFGMGQQKKCHLHDFQF